MKIDLSNSGGRDWETKPENLVHHALMAESLSDMVFRMVPLSEVVLRDIEKVEEGHEILAVGTAISAAIIHAYELGLDHGDHGTPIIFKEQLQQDIIKGRKNKKP